MLEYADGVGPIEIKAASTFAASFAAGLAILEPRSPRGSAVVLGGGREGVRGTTRIVPWTKMDSLASGLDL